MAKNLYGENYESLDEYAKRLIKVGFSKPTYKIRINSINYYPNRGIDISITDLDNNILKSGTNFAGIYSVWEGIPNRTNCLYVGGSAVRINDRIYRFMKELCNVSRDDEDHPAAKKCRLFGHNPHDMYLKILPKCEFPEIRNDFVDINDDEIELFIDEYIAPLLSAKYNKKVKK